MAGGDLDSGIEMVLVPPVRDLGDGFNVRRALPSAKRRMVGPFIFFDRMGPVKFGAGDGLDVRPHPHIGLATVTYLLEGEILHRDSLGSVQAIRPGEVNWMTAGRGIVHSERTDPALRPGGPALSGVQTWLALPESREETEPAFVHYGTDALPGFEAEGIKLRLIAGDTDGLISPVKTASPTLYADVVLDAGARWPVPKDHIERGFYILSGTVAVEGQDGTFGADQLVILKPEAEVVLRATEATRLMLVGGEPMAEKRFIYWNFVSSRPERIEQAKADWREGRFAGVDGEPDVIPLPPEPPGRIKYR